MADFFAPDSVALWWPAMVAAVLAGVGLGYVGTFVLVKRAVFVGAAVGQVSMVGLAVFLLVQSAPAPESEAATGPGAAVATVAAPAAGETASDSAADALDALVDAPLDEPVVTPPPAPAATHGDAAQDHDEGESLWGLVFAVLGAMLVSAALALAPKPKRITTEAIIGIGYVTAAAIVVVVRDLAPGKAGHIDQIIFGTAATVPKARVIALAIATLAVLAVHLAYRRRFILCAFDPEFARTRGYDPMRYNVLLFLTFAVAIAVATDAIGALPVFGLLVLPPAAALMVTREMGSAIKLAPALGALAAVVGYLLSWFMNLPTGAMQVVTGVLVLGGCAVVARVRR